ncbi:hypothetical protein EXS71_01435 [Candidatus Uhrbacteria bacterium]|nr:hypothetical protein [Candidatus Uhrbacteria bacterium]
MEFEVPEVKKSSPHKKIKFVICMFFIMLMVFAFLKIRELSDPGRDDPAPTTMTTVTTTQDQLDQIRIGAFVAALISVPPGQPSVEYVSDTITLKKLNPIFYQDVARGDWVVTYSTFVVIYRPGENKIVNLLPIK